MKRSIILFLAVVSCGKSENAAVEEARKEQAAEKARTAGDRVAAPTLTTPVPGGAKIPCTELIDVAAFQKALGETEAITVKDVTGAQSDVTASCSIVRGGKQPSAAEQKELIKKNGVLGVLGGDELCNVTAFCSSIEDGDRFKKRCAEQGLKDDDTMGSYACVQTVVTGVHDVKNFKFFDEDTKCILQVRGGPGMVDNDFIATCAKAARDLVTPAQIALQPGGAAAASGSGSGSGSGS